jgi:hypothetical protein
VAFSGKASLTGRTAPLCSSPIDRAIDPHLCTRSKRLWAGNSLEKRSHVPYANRVERSPWHNYSHSEFASWTVRALVAAIVWVFTPIKFE